MTLISSLTDNDLPSNVLRYPGGRVDQMFEGQYMLQVAKSVRELNPQAFAEHRIIFYTHKPYSSYPDFAELGDCARTILFILSDETDTVPTHLSSRFKAVFKSYWVEEGAVGNIHPLPLGCSDGVSKVPYVHFDARQINVFFSGNLNSNRFDLFRQFTALRNLPPFDIKSHRIRQVYKAGLSFLEPRRDFSAAFPSSLIKFTPGFARGMQNEEYARHLAGAKIAICAKGFLSQETIRHFEAMKCGCVIISSRLPRNRFYAGSPIIQMASWRELDSTVRMLLEDPYELSDLGRRTLDWWNEVCSPSAVAKYVCSTFDSHANFKRD